MNVLDMTIIRLAAGLVLLIAANIALGSINAIIDWGMGSDEVPQRLHQECSCGSGAGRGLLRRVPQTPI